MTTHVRTVSSNDPAKAVKSGEGCAFQITSADFVAAVFPILPEGAFAASCSKSGDPGLGGLSAWRADLVAANSPAANNNFIGCASFYPGADGFLRLREYQFAPTLSVQSDGDISAVARTTSSETR